MTLNPRKLALAAAHLGTAAFVAAVPQIARAQAAAFDNVSNFSEFVTVFWQYASHIVFTLAVLTIITGGVVYVASAGAEERIDSAKEIIRGAVISIILVVISGSAIDMLIEKPQRGVACHQVPETVNGAQVMKEVCTSPDDAFKVINNVSSAVVASFVASTLISKDVYRQVGLDPVEAARAARTNPHWHESRRWMAEKIMAFLDEQGMLTWYTRPIYAAAHLV